MAGAALVSAFGQLARATGKILDKAGQALEVFPYVEHLAPSTKVLAHAGKSPAIHQSAFIAPTASVIGQVKIGKGSSVWYGATVRGDINKVTIGEQTTIGDRAVVHVAKLKGDMPTIIGSRVTVGPLAVIHAATLEDESLVGAGAQVLDKAVVQKHAAVASGAVLTPGKVVPTGQLWAGIPAKFQRELTAQEIANMKATAIENFEMATIHKDETSKDYKTVALDLDDWEDAQERSDDYWPRLKRPVDPADVGGMGVPGRLFNHPLTVPIPEKVEKDEQEGEGPKPKA